jgi:hypothetical protein
MALNVGEAVDLIELLCKGVDPLLAGNHELVRKIMDMKLKEFAHRTGILETKSTRTSVADQQEYELPSDSLHVSKVVFDDYKCVKISFSQVEEMQGKA